MASAQRKRWKINQCQWNKCTPSSVLQKGIEIDDEKRLQNLYERRMAQETDGAVLGEEFAGYVMHITGGNYKQGFPMRQEILTTTRVRLLMHKSTRVTRDTDSAEQVNVNASPSEDALSGLTLLFSTLPWSKWVITPSWDLPMIPSLDALDPSVPTKFVRSSTSPKKMMSENM
jgi:ribosomal protein S6E (S10)